LKIGLTCLDVLMGLMRQHHRMAFSNFQIFKFSNFQIFKLAHYHITKHSPRPLFTLLLFSFHFIEHSPLIRFSLPFVSVNRPFVLFRVYPPAFQCDICFGGTRKAITK